MDGIVFFGGNEMKVYAVYASKRMRKRVFPIPNPIKLQGAPAVADGYVIASGDGVDGLNAATGALVWTQNPFPIDTGIVALRTSPNPTTIWNHIFFVSDGGNAVNIVAALSTSGEMVWHKFTPEWTGRTVRMDRLTNITVHDGTLYFYAGGDCS